MNGRRLLVIVGFLVQAPGLSAAPIVWNNPWGTATIFDAGPLATGLSARAQLATDDERESLLFTDATSSPAVAETSVGFAASLLTSRAQLSVEESNDSGLLLFGSSRVTSASGDAGMGLGTSEVAIYLLITLDAPAVIQVLDLTSSLTGGSATAFSLTISASDSAGVVTGSPLLAFAGGYPSAEGSVVGGSAGTYLLEMHAKAGPAPQARTDFFFRFDLASIASVPEPGTVGLLAAALAGMLALRRRPRSG